MSGADPNFILVDAGLATWPADGQSSKMLHLAARIGPHSFSRFILPTDPISRQAYEATGLELKDGDLCRLGKPLKALNERIVMEEFLQFVAAHGRTREMVLVAHNVKVLFSVVEAIIQQGLCLHFLHFVKAGHTSAAEIRRRLNIGAYGDGGDGTLRGLAKQFNCPCEVLGPEPITDQRIEVLCVAATKVGLAAENLDSPYGGSFEELHSFRNSVREPKCGCRLDLLFVNKH